MIHSNRIVSITGIGSFVSRKISSRTLKRILSPDTIARTSLGASCHIDQQRTLIMRSGWQPSYLDGTPEIMKLLDAVNQLNGNGANSDAARCNRKSVHRISEERGVYSVELRSSSFPEVEGAVLHVFGLKDFHPKYPHPGKAAPFMLHERPCFFLQGILRARLVKCKHRNDVFYLPPYLSSSIYLPIYA